MRGEDLRLEDIERLDFGEDIKIALSRALAGANVYMVGPPGSGKTSMLRKMGVYMHRLGREPLYVKLEWVKYGWGVRDYVKHYGYKIKEILGTDPLAAGDVVLLDDAELLWSYASVYRNIVGEIRGRQIIAAFREIDVDTVNILFGDGFIIHLQGRRTPRPLAKAPLGLGFLGKTSEIVVL
ncbi:MAG: ATP-binding protein [Pyrobaculum sp.]|uniref:ATP-binding protein n=2 Tax=Pyrobaculum sp. TaxID=2004705 RepID=UPI003178E38E